MNRYQRACVFLACALAIAGAALQLQAKVGSGTAAAYMLVIHESADDTPQQARVIEDKGWRDAADEAGIRWVVIDKDESGKRWPAATKLAIKLGLPAVVWLDAGGKPSIEKLPLLVRGMRESVKKHGGGK